MKPLKFKYPFKKIKPQPLEIHQLIPKKRYTIDDLSEGKCILFNGGNFKALKKVLELTYPQDSTENLMEYWKYKFFGGMGVWEFSNDSESFGNLPIQAVELFLTDYELKTNSDEKEYPITFLIDQLNKRGEKLGMKVDVMFKTIER